MPYLHDRMGNRSEGKPMTGTLSFYDAAWPPSNPPIADGVCIYIGGDTPHVWSLADIASQHARYRLPIFVRSNPPGPGAAADVASAVAMLHLIGAPKGKLVAWDMETAADAAYIQAVYGDLSAAGYKLIVYGSESTVLGNDNPDGLYWGADWTDVPHFAWHNVITQWVSFSGYDEDLASSALPFWDTQPSPVPAWQEAMMQALPVISTTQNNDDTDLSHWLIHRIQLVANGIFHADPQLEVDGSYGPVTAAAVAKIQTGSGLVADGIVGPATWPLIVGTQ